MDRIMSRCGLVCSECPAYIARRTDDNALREKTAAEWAKAYKADLKPVDINCDGCATETGVHFSYCFACEIRKCAGARKLANCSVCADYACDKLSGFFKMAPTAKENLDRLRGT